MSGKISGLVWDLDLPHAEAWVLMSMADHAEHDGSNVFPSQPLIAWKTGYSVRQVRRIQDRLKARKILIPEGFGPHGTTLFRIDLSHAPLKPDFSRADKMSSEDKMSVVWKRPTSKGPRTRRDRMSAADKMSSEDISDGRADIQMSYEPSLETSKKEKPPEKANAFSSPTNESEPQWMRAWPKAKRFPDDFPHNPPSWFLDWAVEHVPHVDVAHEWPHMRDYTYKATRTQFFMCAQKWMENEEEKRQANGSRASPKRFGQRDTSPEGLARELKALQDIDKKGGAW